MTLSVAVSSSISFFRLNDLYFGSVSFFSSLLRNCSECTSPVAILCFIQQSGVIFSMFADIARASHRCANSAGDSFGLCLSLKKLSTLSGLGCLLSK